MIPEKCGGSADCELYLAELQLDIPLQEYRCIVYNIYKMEEESEEFSAFMHKSCAGGLPVGASPVERIKRECFYGRFRL